MKAYQEPVTVRTKDGWPATIHWRKLDYNFRIQASGPASVTGRLTVTSVPVPTSLLIWISPR